MDIPRTYNPRPDLGLKPLLRSELERWARSQTYLYTKRVALCITNLLAKQDRHDRDIEEMKDEILHVRTQLYARIKPGPWGREDDERLIALLLERNRRMNRIKELREERGMSQEDLAEAIGMTVSSVSRHESGDRGFDSKVADKYAEVLGVSVVELFVEPDNV